MLNVRYVSLYSVVFLTLHFSLSSSLVEVNLCYLVFGEEIQKDLSNVFMGAVLKRVVTVTEMLKNRGMYSGVGDFRGPC